MLAGFEELLLGADLDDAPRVHDGDAVGQVGDHGEVVGDVEGGDPVALGEVADRVEDVRLGGHVESRGRLVQDDHLGPVGERHGDRHALLLAARELMRVAAQEVAVGGQEHLGHHLGEALLALAPEEPKSCASRISMSWVPMRRAGLKEAEESWGT